MTTAAPTEPCDAEGCRAPVVETSAHYLGPFRLCRTCCDRWLDDAALYVEENP